MGVGLQIVLAGEIAGELESAMGIGMRGVGTVAEGALHSDGGMRDGLTVSVDNYAGESSHRNMGERTSCDCQYGDHWQKENASFHGNLPIVHEKVYLSELVLALAHPARVAEKRLFESTGRLSAEAAHAWCADGGKFWRSEGRRIPIDSQAFPVIF